MTGQSSNLWRLAVILGMGTLCALTALGGRIISPPTAQMLRFVPPAAPYTLDAGASQILPLGAEGNVVTRVGVSITSGDQALSEKPVIRWSVAKCPAGATARIEDPAAAQTKLTLDKTGAYFLRVDVKVGSWADWQSVVVQVFSPSETGFAMDRFPPPPAPGVHPRIYFNPEDVPRLREHLNSSVFGREMALRLELNSLLLREGPRGFDPKGRLGKLIDGSPSVVNAGYWGAAAVAYRKLVAGDATALGTSIPNMGGSESHLAMQMAAEGLWCLLKDDKQGAEHLAAAITTWAQIVTPTIKPDDDWQWDDQNIGLVKYSKQEMGRIFDKVGRENIGLCYDFIFNYMTPRQRDIVRQMIATATAHRTGFGMDQPHYARTGNWVTFHTTSLILLSLSIEGETGYDPTILQRGSETLRDFYQYSLMEDGESSESIGKGGAQPRIVMALAKRGVWVAAHPHLLAYDRRYLLNCIQPYGYKYIALSTLGDAELSGELLNDACVARYCYPKDPDVELMARNLLGENYGGAFKCDDLVTMTLWGEDYTIPAGQPWHWDQSQPLTYIGRDQGLVVTRNQWTKDALYLFFDCGTNIRGAGHYDPARNMFILSALGRNWIGDTGKEEMAEAHNVVLIDGKGGSKYPGRLVSVTDRPEYTSLCGDAKPAYDWEWDRRALAGMQVEPMTINQLRYQPLPERWMDTPISYLYSVFGPFNVLRKAYNPVQVAYRTALLRRGRHPYVVIADDIQKDSQSHHYEFLLRTPMDLTHQFTVNGNDVVLADPGSRRRMLVRLVTPEKIQVTERELRLRTDLEKIRPILSIATDAVRPDFRVVFYPYLEGEALPTTAWDDARSDLRVDVEGQRDICHYVVDANGHPSVELATKN
jgi:hypothetical protein